MFLFVKTWTTHKNGIKINSEISERNIRELIFFSQWDSSLPWFVHCDFRSVMWASEVTLAQINLSFKEDSEHWCNEFFGWNNKERRLKWNIKLISKLKRLGQLKSGQTERKRNFFLVGAQDSERAWLYSNSLVGNTLWVGFTHAHARQGSCTCASKSNQKIFPIKISL